MTSRSANPSVVTRAVTAPRRSSTALVATVVPWAIDETEAASARVSASRRPRSKPSLWSSGVVGTLQTTSWSAVATTTSVKVPPTSIPLLTPRGPRPSLAASPATVRRPSADRARSPRRAPVPPSRRPRSAVPPTRPRASLPSIPRGRAGARHEGRPGPCGEPPQGRRWRIWTARGPGSPLRNRARSGPRLHVTASMVGASRLRLHGPQNLPVVVVGEGRTRLCEGNPPQLVHLGVGCELPVGGAQGLHRPVADDLRPSLPVPVADLAGGLAKAAVQPRLLLHLPERRLLVGLAGIELALGQRPVVVGGAMDQRHLDRAAVRPSQHHPTCRLHGLLPLKSHRRAPVPST